MKLTTSTTGLLKHVSYNKYDQKVCENCAHVFNTLMWYICYRCDSLLCVQCTNLAATSSGLVCKSCEAESDPNKITGCAFDTP